MDTPKGEYEVGDLTLVNSQQESVSAGVARLVFIGTGPDGQVHYRVFLPRDMMRKAKSSLGAEYRTGVEPSREPGDPPRFESAVFRDRFGGRITGHFLIRDPRLDAMEKATGEPWVQTQPYEIVVLVENLVGQP